ncbi:MAG: EAL domain-containing protein [Hylemonella sp.]|nr:EAL domain-containing protein [Hylemonella sp.]
MSDPLLRQRAQAQWERKAPVMDRDLTPEAARAMLHELQVHQIELEMQNEELRQSQSALGAAQGRYLDLFEQAPIGYITVSDAGLILACNLTAAGLLGVSRGGVIQKPWTHLIAKEDQDAWYLLRKRLGAGQQAMSVELRLVRSDGSRLSCVLGAVNVKDELGALTTRVAITDMTELKQAQSTQRSNAAALQAISQGVILTTSDYLIVATNAAFVEITGYSEAEVLGRNCRFLQGPDTDPETIQSIRAALRQRQGFHGEILNYRKDGSPFWNALTITPVLDQQKGLTHFVGVTRDITESVNARLALERSYADLKRSSEMLEHTGAIAKVGGWEVDLQSMKLSWTQETFRIAGIEPSIEPALEEGINIFAPEARPTISAAVQAAIDSGTSYDLELPIIAADGQHKWVRTQGFAEMHSGKAVRIYGTFQDISSRKAADDMLRRSEERRLIATDSGRVAIWEVDLPTGKLTWDENCFSLYKIQRENFAGTFEAWAQVIHPQDLEAVKASFQNAVAGVGEYGVTFRILWPDGEIRYIEAHGRVLRNPDGVAERVVGTNWDVTAIRRYQSQLEQMAKFDPLTQLPNRLLLRDRLNQAMGQVRRREKMLAVAYIDLDAFKSVNDSYGHDVGDRFLIAQAHAIKGCLREGDTLARIGGDEFVAVFIDLDSPESCWPMLDRILLAAAAEARVGDLVLQGSASMGVTFYPQADIDPDQLLRQADQAMYQAKLMGRNRYRIFDSDHDSYVRVHHKSLEDIRQALERREFVLYYQPKVNMRTGEVIGAEALIRWQHPEKGLLAPATFLSEIENDPLAIAVGEWVMDTALTQIERWHAAGLDLPVSVNVGARQLQQTDFVGRLRTILSQHPEVPRGKMDLEVLETSALDDIAQVSRVVEECAQIGVAFALDDFGTGYSSLTYLRRLKVAQLKIDQSFVRDMLEDPDDLAILQGVIGLASAFKREVIAEGVETVAHGTALLHLGCELAQGYGIARPMPAEQMLAWVKNWQPDSAWSKFSGEGEAREPTGR